MLATPTPGTLYVHDDLSDELRARGEASPPWRLGQELFGLLRRDPARVIVLTLAEQLDALIARGPHAPFATTIAVGGAGAGVAAAVHARTGWFPAVRRVDVWREEAASGEYVLAGPAPLAAQLRDLPDASPLAIVDDTVFSGFTVRAVLAALPAPVRSSARVFCLRGVAESVVEVARLAPVSAGIAAPGRVLADVSFINASGLVRRGAIRRAGLPPLAFFEREPWMKAWFPRDHAEITALCRALCEVLEAGAQRR